MVGRPGEEGSHNSFLADHVLVPDDLLLGQVELLSAADDHAIEGADSGSSLYFCEYENKSLCNYQSWDRRLVV